MKSHTLLILSTLVLCFFSLGCLVQPMSEEEEAELLEEMLALDGEIHVAMDGEGPFDAVGANKGKPEPTPWIDAPVTGKSERMANGSTKPDPIPWFGSSPEGDSDPIWWRSEHGSRLDSSPRMDETTGAQNLVDSLSKSSRSVDNKPDPTPWHL